MWIIQAAVTRDTNAIVVLEKDTTVDNKWAKIFGTGIVPGLIWVAAEKAYKVVQANRYSSDNFPAVFSMPIFKVTPEEIFADEVPALHANFINPRNYGDAETYTVTSTNKDGEEEVTEKTMNSAKNLQDTIGKWYVTVRNIVLVSLMIVLLYVGIRILISTAAEEKAKYLESLKNWLIALILVIFMHYIMALAQTATQYITDMLASQSQKASIVLPQDFYDQLATDANLSDDAKAAVEANKTTYIDNQTGEQKTGIEWKVNLMELAKIRSQMIGTDESGNDLTGLSKLGYTFIYLIFVIFTLTFVITYLKRLVYLAFLTLIAPMVALTYPIDKIKDGQAQAFNMWLQEYMFNLLLQPLHYLLYIVLIGTAMDIATTNMLYAIAAMGFLMEAEQLMRKFFGFEKAATTGKVMGGLLGGALAINALQNIGKLGSGVKGSKSGGSSSSSGGGDGRVKTVDPADRSADSGSDDMDTLIGKVRDGNNGQETGLLDDGNGQNPPQLTEEQERVLADMRSYRDAGMISDEEYERQMNNYLGSGNQPTDQRSTDVDTSRIQQDAAQAEGENPLRTLNNDSSQKRPRRKVIRGIGRVAKTYAPGMARKALRFTARGAGAAILGMYGLAAGVASGDSSKVLQYGAIGAGAGMALGNAGVNLAENAVQGGKDAREVFRQGAYTPDELKQIRNQEADRKWKRNRDIDTLYKEQYEKYCKKRNMEVTKEGYKKYKDAALAIRQQSGITDDKIIAKSINAGGIEKHNDNLLLAKACKDIKGDKELETFRKRLQENGLSKEQISDISKNIRTINDF